MPKNFAEVPESERLTVSIERAGELLGISRPQAYRLANNGTLPILKLGHRKVVPKIALERMLAEVWPTNGTGGNNATN